MKKLKYGILLALVSSIILTGCSMIRSDNAKDLYTSKNVDENIRDAYLYFDENVKSASIRKFQTIEGNTETAKLLGVGYMPPEEVVNYEKSKSKNYAIRRDAKEETVGTISMYADASGVYSNFKEANTESGFEITDKLHGTPSSETRDRFDLESCSELYTLSVTKGPSYEMTQEIYQDAKKEQIVNKDGSMDFIIHANVDRLNAKEKEQYDYEFSQEYINALEQEFSGFIEKDELMQDALSKRGTSVSYYPKTYYTKIHVDSKGVIVSIEEQIELDSYANHVNGTNSSFRITKKCLVSKINNNKVKKSDVNLMSSKKLSKKDRFTKNLSPEETNALKDGDVIDQLPDIPTLVSKDLYYILNNETGVIVFRPLSVAYLPWDERWVFDASSSSENTPEEKEIIKVLEAMPSFQEIKANNPYNARIDYQGRGQWSN